MPTVCHAFQGLAMRSAVRSLAVPRGQGHSLRYMSAQSAANNPTVAFFGLGAMGYQMAKRLALNEASTRTVLVWNRTTETAAKHAEEHNTKHMNANAFTNDGVGQASIVFMCLPTSDVTFETVKNMAPHLKDGCIVVDSCTGNPFTTKKIAEWLSGERPDVKYMDCPISGGPAGASKGTLAAMLGGCPEAAEIVRPHIQAFAANIVYLGPTGSGHAVKAVNNACNVSNLLCLHEGLLALKHMGVCPSAALEVINKSSGRSLMSLERIPKEVITGDFNYGFKLGLMAKDVNIATELMDEYFPGAQVYRRTQKVHFDAMAAGTVSFDSDYTEIVKHQELIAGTKLRADGEKIPAPRSAREVELSEQLKKLQAENESLRAQLQESTSNGAPAFSSSDTSHASLSAQPL